uniref:uncharacterized protein LOC120336773 isoform X1 n=1 Tax=Styela clava TaxID=7725 RepID=UPI00193A9DC5|nr:uncharacterized protein LOC120336773 isoform X1 [Styela clava]
MAEQANSRLHISTTIIAIMLGMMVLDAYLVQQNTGSRRTGVLVMLLIGDVCLLFVLRYVGVWVGTEVRSMKRGCSMAEWFLLIFVLDIKMYFVQENVRKECFTEVEKAIEQSLAVIEEEKPASIFQPELVFSGKENLSTEELMLAYAQIGVRSVYGNILKTCDYDMITKKTLTLFQAVFIPGFYLLLLGADYLEGVSNLRELDEIKMRAFWVVVDLLDLLDLQSNMWESNQGELPYITVGFIYFYCYIILIVLPPLSLAEMSKRNQSRPHEMLIYLLASFVTINLATTAIRLVLLVSNRFAGVSSIFIGKNVVCIFLKSTKLLQIYLVKKKKIRFHRDDETTFKLNDLKKDERNQTTLGELEIGKDIVTVDTQNMNRKDGSVRRKQSDGNIPGKDQKSMWCIGISNEEEHMKYPRNSIKECNTFVTNLGKYSSPTVVSHKTTSSDEYHMDYASGCSTWTPGFLNAARKSAAEYRSMDEILNNNLSPDNSADALSRKMSRSISARLDNMFPDGNGEKRVRFRKEKLSPVNSEEHEATHETLLNETKVPENETGGMIRIPSLLSSDSIHPYSSTDNSTSTTDCGLHMKSIKEWNSSVMNHLEALRNNLRQDSPMHNDKNEKERDDLIPLEFQNVQSSDTNIAEDEEDQFPFRIPSPLPDSIPDPQCNDVYDTSNQIFGSIGSLRSELLSPFSPIASAVTSSPSVESGTAPSATTSGILPPPMEINSTNFMQTGPNYFSKTIMLGLTDNSSTAYQENGLELPDENYFRRPLTQYQNSIDSGHLSDTTPFLKRDNSSGLMRKLVNTACQTNMTNTTT